MNDERITKPCCSENKAERFSSRCCGGRRRAVRKDESASWQETGEAYLPGTVVPGSYRPVAARSLLTWCDEAVLGQEVAIPIAPEVRVVSLHMLAPVLIEQLYLTEDASSNVFESL
jgi:hypothetical protein